MRVEKSWLRCELRGTLRNAALASGLSCGETATLPRYTVDLIWGMSRSSLGVGVIHTGKLHHPRSALYRCRFQPDSFSRVPTKSNVRPSRTFPDKFRAALRTSRYHASYGRYSPALPIAASVPQPKVRPADLGRWAPSCLQHRERRTPALRWCRNRRRTNRVCRRPWRRAAR